MTEKIKNLVRVAVLSFIFSAAIGSALANWAPPAGTPPFNNIPPPINVGAATQEKAGNLFLDNWLIAKKAQTISSTVLSDNGKVLTTKDYVDMRINSIKTFGGIYVKNLDGSCRWGNPRTGGCSCPSGYSSYRSHDFSNPQCVDNFYGDGWRTSNCGIYAYQCI